MYHLFTIELFSNFHELCTVPLQGGRCGMSIGCDDGRFIFPKECFPAGRRGSKRRAREGFLYRGLCTVPSSRGTRPKAGWGSSWERAVGLHYSRARTQIIITLLLYNLHTICVFETNLEDTFIRFEKYSSKLDISRSFICIFAPNYVKMQTALCKKTMK